MAHDAILFGDPRLPERFWTKVRIDDSGCWLWTAGCSAAGYGSISVDGRPSSNAHRVLYRKLIEDVPYEVFIDHLCHNADGTCPGGRECIHRRCVNPAHLGPSTCADNVMRGLSPAACNARKTHCVHGHELTPENFRYCRECSRIRQQGYRDRRRGAPVR